MTVPHISASILNADFARLGDDVTRARTRAQYDANCQSDDNLS